MATRKGDVFAQSFLGNHQDTAFITQTALRSRRTLTTIQSFSHFGCFIPRFFMSPSTKGYRKLPKCSTCGGFLFKKSTRIVNSNEFPTRKHKFTREFLRSLAENVRVKRATTAPRETQLNRAIKGEVLRSQRNILPLPFQISSPFIHRNVCTLHTGCDETRIYSQKRSSCKKSLLSRMGSKYMHY